jgi:hypothetical protein
MSSKKRRTRKATKTGSTFRFLDLPDDIHIEIARIIDPRICSDPSRFHADDLEDTPTSNHIANHWQPNQTLARLTLVCKRLHRLYAPFSTWRILYIESTSPLSAPHFHEKLEPSPSLTRVLDYPQTGIYARALLIRFRGFKTRYFVDTAKYAFTQGIMADFDRFLANTPRLETVRCIGCHGGRKKVEISGVPRILIGYYYGDISLPYQFFASLSSLASLRYLYLDGFIIELADSPSFLTSFPPLHQIRILLYTVSERPAIFRDFLRSMPNIHTLHINTNYVFEIRNLYNIVDGIEVCCHFPPTFSLGERLLRLDLDLSLTRCVFGLLSG